MEGTRRGSKGIGKYLDCELWAPTPRAKGERGGRAVTQAQIAATVAMFLGKDFPQMCQSRQRPSRM